MVAARSIGLPPISRWLLALVFTANPYMLVESVSGSGVTLAAFLFLLILFSVGRWLDQRGWLTLTFLGMSGALALITNIYAVGLLAAALILVLASALLEKPVGSHYAEHAFILAASPITYALLIRLSFAFVRYGGLAPLFRLDNLITRPLNLPLAPLSAWDAASALRLLADFIDWVWVVFPLFFFISAFYLLFTAFRLQVSGIFLIVLAWLPAIFSLFDPPSQSIGAGLNRFILLVIPSGLMLALFILRHAGDWKGVLAAAFVVLMLFSNVFSVLTVRSLPAGNEYRTYLDAWLENALPVGVSMDGLPEFLQESTPLFIRQE